MNQLPMPTSHPCDECGKQFQCAGLMAGVPGHCLCTQEVGEFVVECGSTRRRLMFFCDDYCLQNGADDCDEEAVDDLEFIVH